MINKMNKTLFFVLSICFLASPAFAAKAVALIAATEEGSQVSGQATFTEEKDGVELEMKVSNVSPGKHAFHIHETGNCAEKANAAGGHFNPEHVDHGFLPKDGFQHAHVGDFGNIEVGADGNGSVKLFLPSLTLVGEKYNIDGKAVILHEKEDQFVQPTGNAGGRIGCGVIMMTQDENTSAQETTTTTTNGQGT